ncbi:MAG TPA: hypothetical protein ENJ10_10835 [Caldithrix abyssi]|uniref:Uncharacterized protein n=1 Tax=Caldithrix abyssi TaxID=187145 RepID=A0A7V1PVA2_CALAY|nr:hypothetical protein [Caldithrix abyssi]
MAKVSDKGSPLFVLLIILFSIALVIVITVPQKIWDTEKLEKTQAEYNMNSIYEAEKFYHRLTKKYTTNTDTLLNTLAQDSTLKMAEKLVEYTSQLRKLFVEYLDLPYVDALLTISKNINSISDDLTSNKRYFKMVEEILNESEQLNLNLQVFHNDVKLPNYVAAVSALDSIYQLQRDLSDYNLQTAAMRLSQLTSNVNGHLPDVEINDFEEQWKDLTTRISAFVRKVNSSKVAKFTSTADRIKDFNAAVNTSLQRIAQLNKEDNINKAREIQAKIDAAYQTFLKDFIVTNRTAQYRLAEQDSQVLYISKDNFISPINGEPYLILIDQDSADVKVESPVLLKELKEKVEPVAREAAAFTFLPPFGAYADTLAVIHKKALDIKKKIRRNIEITIKNKEIDESFGKYRESTEYAAYKDLKDFIDVAQNSLSFSDIVEASEKGRNAISIFKQIYGENLFNNIDSIHAKIKADLEEYNSILAKVRRLPRGVENFEKDIAVLDALVARMKEAKSTTDVAKLSDLQKQLEELILFAADGITIPQYYIFKKSIKNVGYIYKNTRSWEEKKEK